MKYNKEFFYIRILYPLFYTLMPITLNTNYTLHDRQESRIDRNKKIYIQGVTGGTDQTSGGCSLC